WRIMKVEVEGLKGKLRHLSRSIPSLPLTRNGREFLDWDQGMPLHRFLALVCKSDGSRSIGESFSKDVVRMEIESKVLN
ncbi:MAG: hypothetical protein L7R66_01795, partial [Candidatus Thalassarchaeaceae archaeon]|nr:hypothetical protein [Candidatus Thalassarchaeaceae archaeon]